MKMKISLEDARVRFEPEQDAESKYCLHNTSSDQTSCEENEGN